MPRYDFISQRLFIDHKLDVAVSVNLERQQANYLLNVLRLKDGAPILLFNGRDGEWRATLRQEGRKRAVLDVQQQEREQTKPYDLQYLFAPIKQARMEYMVQKAVEMGSGALQPVWTHHTQLRKLNVEKMRAHATEAAEQCGILSIPTIEEPCDLFDAVNALEGKSQLIFCDEGSPVQNPIEALEKLKGEKLALLVGPEGGFSEDERQTLLSIPHVTPIPLGPRVLRADTAAVAAMALLQAIAGDWA